MDILAKKKTGRPSIQIDKQINMAPSVLTHCLLMALAQKCTWPTTIIIIIWFFLVLFSISHQTLVNMCGLFLQPLTTFDVVNMFGYDKRIERKKAFVSDSVSHISFSMEFIYKHNNPINMVQWYESRNYLDIFKHVSYVYNTWVGLWYDIFNNVGIGWNVWIFVQYTTCKILGISTP